MVDDIRVRGCGHSRTSVIHKTTHSSGLPPIKKVSMQDVFQKQQLSEIPAVLSSNSCQSLFSRKVEVMLTAVRFQFRSPSVSLMVVFLIPECIC